MERRTELLAVAPVMALGLALRLWEAAHTYLNSDEILYFFLALPANLKDLYFSGLKTDHPPLLFFLLHPIVSVTSSELLLRLIPVLAGTIFPWVVYRWLTRVWTSGAGLAALVLLTFSPNLILLSAQVRGYTLELLFAALALLLLDIALKDHSLLAMILFSASLDLAILSEYSAAWFAGAVGIYVLLWVTIHGVSRRLFAAWAMGQLSALVIYANLYQGSISARLTTKSRLVSGFLQGGFPAPHQNLLAFSAVATLKQFAYASSSIVLGIGTAFLFGIGLVILWKGRSPGELARNRIFAALLVVPFVLAASGALLKLHPYARSRHTVILSLFVAAGAAVGLERIFRSRPWAATFAAVALLLFWAVAAEPDQSNIARSQNRRVSMLAAIDYVRSSIPRGSLVLADKETARSLRFYMRDKRELRLQNDFDSPDAYLGSLRLIYRSWDFGAVDDFLRDVASVRSEFGLKPDAPIWIVDGGFDNGIDGRLRKRFPEVTLPAFQDFDGALTVFQTPPGI